MELLPHSHFSTNDLPEKDRMNAWREDISVLFDLERAPISDLEPFHATMGVYHFGQSVLADLKASPGRYVRSKRKASRDGMDAIFLQLFLEGGVQFGTAGRTTYAEAGDIVVFDLAQPVDNINRKFHHITAMYSRSAIEAVVPDISRWHGRSLPRDNPSVALLRQHMITSYDLAPRFTSQEGRNVEKAALLLAGAAMGGDDCLQEPTENKSLQEMLAYQIKRHIRENLGAADQSPEQIAKRFGISRRHLYQLLEPIGGIARYQRHLRLQRSMTDLQNPELAHLQISEIAYRWGFNHPATFNRNFRAAFDITPSDARNRIHDGTATIRTLQAGTEKQRKIEAEHQQWFRAMGI